MRSRHRHKAVPEREMARVVFLSLSIQTLLFTSDFFKVVSVAQPTYGVANGRIIHERIRKGCGSKRSWPNCGTGTNVVCVLEVYGKRPKM